MKNSNIAYEQFVHDMNSKLEQWHTDSLVYGAGYLKLDLDGTITVVDPVTFEKEMIQIVENMYKEKK